MSKTPDRAVSQGLWLTKRPLSVGVVLIAIVVGFGILTYQEYRIWTPLQRWYWNEYLSTQTFPTARGNYWLITKSDGNGHQSVAADTDLVPALLGRHFIPFELSEQARQRGAVQLVLDSVHYSSAQMNQILAGQILAGQSPDDLVSLAWVVWLGIFVLGLVLAIRRNRARARMMAPGRRLKGPLMVTV